MIETEKSDSQKLNEENKTGRFFISKEYTDETEKNKSEYSDFEDAECYDNFKDIDDEELSGNYHVQQKYADNTDDNAGLSQFYDSDSEDCFL
ncbi:MAG: hypothetical protein ACI4LX_08720 [Treponema sp.]